MDYLGRWKLVDLFDIAPVDAEPREVVELVEVQRRDGDVLEEYVAETEVRPKVDVLQRVLVEVKKDKRGQTRQVVRKAGDFVVLHHQRPKPDEVDDRIRDFGDGVSAQVQRLERGDAADLLESSELIVIPLQLVVSLNTRFPDDTASKRHGLLSAKTNRQELREVEVGKGRDEVCRERQVFQGRQVPKRDDGGQEVL